jgi:hypothetical protein
MPVESKARNTDAGVRSARVDAIMQLAAYWSLVAPTQPSDVGYGLIVTLMYQPPRELRASIIVPTNQRTLISELTRTTLDDPNIRRYLHGC